MNSSLKIDETSSRSRLYDVCMQSQSSITATTTTTSTANQVQSRTYVNNRIFSPFSSDYYCIYGLLPRHAHADDVGKSVRNLN